MNEIQLKLISRKLKQAAESLEKEKGLGSLAAYSDYSVWASHANLAGWNVERFTGRMYRDKEKVRTYFD